MNNIETGKGGLNVLLSQICNLRTIEVSKAIFGTRCLNIFATGCLIYARQEKDILLYIEVKITPVEGFQGSFSKEIVLV